MRIDLTLLPDDRIAFEAELDRRGFRIARASVAEALNREAHVWVASAELNEVIVSLRELPDGSSSSRPWSVVLIGTPPGADTLAVKMLPRPVSIEALVQALEESAQALEASPKVRTRSDKITIGEEESEHLPEVLRPDSALPKARFDDAPITGSRLSRPSALELGAFAPISDALRSLLVAADRRVFPNRSALAIGLPGAEESARDLVPAEAFERVDEDELWADPEDEPLPEARTPSHSSFPSTRLGVPMTRAGVDAVPGDSRVPPEAVQEAAKTSPGTPKRLSRLPSSSADDRGSFEPAITSERAVRASVKPARSEARRSSLDLDAAFGRPDLDGVRRATWQTGALAKLLFAILEQQLDVRLRLQMEPSDGSGDADPSFITIEGSEITELTGNVASYALRTLSAREPLPTPLDDAHAARILEEGIARGTLREFDVLRAFSEARVGVIARWLRAPSVYSEMTELGSELRGQSLGPALPIISSAARLGIDRSAARAIIASHARVLCTDLFDERLRMLQLPAEYAALARACDGEIFSRWLDEGMRDPHLPGTLIALWACDALELRNSEVQMEEPAPTSARALELLQASLSASADATYFAVLGIPEHASGSEVEGAYERRVREIESLPLDPTSTGLRDSMLVAIREAHRVLSSPRWRDAYRRAISRSRDVATRMAQH